MATRWTMATRLITLCIGSLVVLGGTTNAKQLGFSREELLLHYEWQYDSAQKQTFSLMLPAESALPAWSAWRQTQANAFIFQELVRDAQEHFPDVRFRYNATKAGNQLDFETTDKALFPEIHTWLAQQQKILLDAYLDMHYYKRFAGNENQLVHPDHMRIANDTSAELLEVATKLKEIILESASDEQKNRYQNDEKSLVIAGLLNFVQSIPYDPLESINGQRGIGFLMPEQVLLQNRGDCDSKSTLLMSLMLALYPDLPQTMVYVPEHALLAIKLSLKTGQEETINIDGLPFIPLEVSGPAEIAPGELSEKSRLFVQSNQYQYERVQPMTTNSTPN